LETQTGLSLGVFLVHVVAVKFIMLFPFAFKRAILLPYATEQVVKGEVKTTLI